MKPIELSHFKMPICIDPDVDAYVAPGSELIYSYEKALRMAEKINAILARADS